MKERSDDEYEVQPEDQMPGRKPLVCQDCIEVIPKRAYLGCLVFTAKEHTANVAARVSGPLQFAQIHGSSWMTPNAMYTPKHAEAHDVGKGVRR